MAPESVTQDRIYHAVKADYLLGQFQPGARIDLQSIADRHRASTTPVREAVHRLIGERLFEPHPDGGFRLITADSIHLAHLYAWYGQQLLAALHLLRNAALLRAFEPFRATEVADPPIRQVERVDMIFQAIANQTGNIELIDQIASANERLRYPRLAEIGLFSNAARELANLTRNGNFAGVSNVRRRITAYHDRRVLHATEIANMVMSHERPW